MRLFRQKKFGDWDQVINKVAGELSKYAKENQGVD
jgi:hypothetical protein